MISTPYTRRRKQLSFIVCIGLCSASHTLSANEFSKQTYIGGGLGVVNLSPIDINGERVPYEQYADRSITATFGRDFSPRLSAELQYHSLGENTADADEEFTYSDLTLSGLYYVSGGFTKRTGLSPYARLGIGQIKTTSDVEIQRDHEAHLMAGAGIEYAIANGFGFRAEYNYHDKDAKQTRLGLVYRFNSAPDIPLLPADQSSVYISEADSTETPESPVTTPGQPSDTVRSNPEPRVSQLPIADPLPEPANQSLKAPPSVSPEIDTSIPSTLPDAPAIPAVPTELFPLPAPSVPQLAESDPSQTEITWIESTVIESTPTLTASTEAETTLSKESVLDASTAEAPITEAADKATLQAQVPAEDSEPVLTTSEVQLVEVARPANTPIECTELTQFSIKGGACTLTQESQQSLTFMIESSSLTEQARLTLNRIGLELQNYPNIKFSIQAHTDNRGDAQQNLQLSIDRARAVARHLLAGGLPIERVASVRAFGGAEPISTNDTPAGRRNNRRVVITLVNAQ